MAFQDIRKSQKFLTPADVGFVVGVALCVGALLALNIYLARNIKGGEWLFLRWSGARAFSIEKIEPYGAKVAQRIQEFVYERDAFLNEYPYALNDPFYIVLLYTPLTWFSDFTIARGIWMLFSQIALIVIVLLSLNLIEWKPPIWMTLLLIGLGVFNAFSISALVSASPAILLTLLYLGILVALRTYLDELAGVLLCLAAYQWEIGALFFLFIFIFVIANRRWGVLAGFSMALIVLVAVSLLINFGWVIGYLRAALFDWRRSLDITFWRSLSNIFPGLNIIPGTWLAIVMAMLGLFEFIRAVNADARHIMWAVCFSLAANFMMGFAIFPSDHVILLPAMVLLTALVWERWHKWRISMTLLLLVFYIGLSYILHIQAINTSFRFSTSLLKIVPPTLGVIGLYWMRWWAVRPPRIWADQIGDHK